MLVSLMTAGEYAGWISLVLIAYGGFIAMLFYWSKRV